MKKIGIITIPDYNNYGNRLQNYAVKLVFEKMGYNVVTLEMNDFAFKKYRARKYKLILKKFKIIPVIFLFEVISNGIMKAFRQLYFEKFSSKYLNLRYFPKYTQKVLNKINKEIDFFILGSDQIWHPFVNDTPNLYFASFTEEKKKIYFAPSFGVKQLPIEYSKLVKSKLENATNLSVREVEGAKLIFELTGNIAEVLFDPTLMITASEWEKIEKRPFGLKDENFILCYFLGPISKEYEIQIKKMEKEIGAKVFYLADINNLNGYITGPREFIYCINHAKMILTDSFHAAVFSIIFHKPFSVFTRLNEKLENAGLDSRVDTLLGKLKATEHKYIMGKDCCQLTNYYEADKIIEGERERAKRFLQKCLSENGDE